MKTVHGLLLNFLLIATPFLSFANEIEQHEINTEQTGESRWGKTILHGASALLSGCLIAICVHAANDIHTTPQQVKSTYFCSAICTASILSSGTAIYDLHKKNTLPVSSVQYDESALEKTPLEK